MSLTWNGIENIMDVEKIKDIFEGKERNTR